MADSEETKKSRVEMQNLSLDSTSSVSRDFLHRFMEPGGSGLEKKKEKKDKSESDEIELNLGLSLGGRFGVDKSSKSNLVRSSSVAACFPVIRDDDTAAAPPAAAHTSLARTSSLPVETEEEWRKRKELQTLRRMQAKRRRSEKQRNKDEKSNLEDAKKDILKGRLDRFGLSVPPQTVLQPSFGNLKGKSSDFSKVQGVVVQPSSQGSVESQGGSSSSMSELESKSIQGSGELSPGSFQSTQEIDPWDVGSSGVKTAMNLVGKMAGAEIESTSNKASGTSDQAREIGTNAMEDMPCVFTKGDGPNGKRVDGILYKYGKGQEVRIMCVCHGSFLSPAEFVRHAGGTDVTHPLKHIVINPNSSSFQ